MRRFLDRVAALVTPDLGDADRRPATQEAGPQDDQKVTQDIEALRFNTAMSTMMILIATPRPIKRRARARR